MARNHWDNFGKIQQNAKETRAEEKRFRTVGVHRGSCHPWRNYSVPVEGNCWMRTWAANNFSECTSKRRGWKSNCLAVGRTDGLSDKHLRMKSFKLSSSSDSMVLFTLSSVTARELPTDSSWISNAAISRAHMPNE